MQAGLAAAMYVSWVAMVRAAALLAAQSPLKLVALSLLQRVPCLSKRRMQARRVAAAILPCAPAVRPLATRVPCDCSQATQRVTTAGHCRWAWAQVVLALGHLWRFLAVRQQIRERAVAVLH